MNIGKLSEKVGLTSKTIRYYEDIGLISHASRADNGYRDYDASNVDELKIIKYARELGLPIDKIKKLMTGCHEGSCSHSKEYLIGEIDEYIKILEEREVQMNILKKRLMKLKNNYGKNKNTKYCCNILGQLTEMDGGGDTK